MSIQDIPQAVLAKLPRGWADAIYSGAMRIPRIRRTLEAEHATLLEGTPPARPDGDHRVFSQLPTRGLNRNDILGMLRSLAQEEQEHWEDGQASGAVYHGGAEHIEFLNQVYALHSQSNPLHVDVWPSGMKFEAEVVAMTAAILGGDSTDDEIVGTVTSGGTESILMAMKAYRDRSRTRRPEMVIPDSAHIAFDKAAHYFGYRQIRVPVASDFRADVDAMARAITRRTVVVAGSAPGYPHGVVDPIPQLADMAAERGIGFHTDACLGGFVLPWAERLGYAAPPFDFRLPGVTSMSTDTHKYGYSAKGTSVVLYRGRALRHKQFFVATEWPGGLYYSPTMAGSRSGALLATAWAALLSLGEAGYQDAAERILETGATVRAGIAEIPELRVLGDPLWVIAFASETVDIYEVMARMAQRGWSLNGLHHPPAVHVAITLRHTQPGVANRFLEDLRAAVAGAAAAGTKPQTGSAPMYGMAATFPARRAISELLRRFIDKLYEVKE
jgi:glutamate/tyrosine decarboxylase-like PLP-dependent enzyme